MAWVRMQIRTLVMHTKLRDSAARFAKNLKHQGSPFGFGRHALIMLVLMWAPAKHHKLAAAKRVPVTRRARMIGM